MAQLHARDGIAPAEMIRRAMTVFLTEKGFPPAQSKPHVTAGQKAALTKKRRRAAAKAVQTRQAQGDRGAAARKAWETIRARKAAAATQKEGPGSD
jgi:hypothetical protein